MLFTPAKDGKITVAQVLVPLSLVAFILFIMLAFQTSQILRDRDVLHQQKSRQDKPMEDTQKVQAQLDALAVGTKKLAEGGNKSAQAIIARMKQMGITVNETKGGATPAPAASTTPPAEAPEPATPPESKD
jgi:hypothetical protein